MKIEMRAIARVESSRSEVQDDIWGDQVSSIVLEPEYTPEALQGIRMTISVFPESRSFMRTSRSL